MKNVTFKLAQHTIRDVQMVEIWVSGVYRGALYPGDPIVGGVRLVSRYFDGEPLKIPDPLGADIWQFLFKD